MKKMVSFVTSCALSISLISGMCISGQAAKEDTDYVIPYVAENRVPVIDGVSSPGEWDKALVIDVNKDTEGVWVTDVEGLTEPPENAASMKAYLLWSSDLTGIDPEFAYLDYDYNTDKKGGLYFKFEVEDHTKAWANGIWSQGTIIGDRNAEQGDGVQVVVDPLLSRKVNRNGCWKYTVNAYSAGAPGVGGVPSGTGFWWEHWSISPEIGGAGTGTSGIYWIEAKSTVDWEYDPAHPRPEGPEPDFNEDSTAWMRYKQAMDDAAEHATALKGYTIELFLPWIALNVSNASIVPSTTAEYTTQFGMCLNLLDWSFKWDSWDGVYDHVQHNWYANFNKSTMGSNDGNWSHLAMPKRWTNSVFELAPSIGESSIVRGDATGDGDVKLNDVTAIAMHVAGIKTLTGDGLLAADTNNDGEVKLNDVTAVAMHVAGIQTLE